ncbi:pilus assembly protein PilM [Patescibacteria group bacterium]|nr:pilus assembly protein PilM [Patescibacteria group bacterium]
MMTIVGLDIGSHTIKVVELAHDKGKCTLLAAGSGRTPKNVLVSQDQKDREQLAETIKKLLKDTGIQSQTVNIALPESQVFTRIIETPQLSKVELSSAIKWEAEQYIPLPLDQVSVDFSILRDSRATGTSKMDVLLVASPRTLIDRYLSILELADLSPNIVETEIIATTRSLLQSASLVKTAMIVSLGAQTTDLSIIRQGILTFTRSISAGGEALSRALAQGLGFELSQAEEFKRAYGVERDKLEGKIVEAVKPIMDTIIGEINRAIAYYQEKYRGEHIDAVFLSGGTARLPGMVVYFAQSLNIEVQLANPWTSVIRDPRFRVLDPEGPVFTVATGLALRE